MNNDIRNQIDDEFLDKYIFKNFFIYDGFRSQTNIDYYSDLNRRSYDIIVVPINQQLFNDLVVVLRDSIIQSIEDSNSHR